MLNHFYNSFSPLFCSDISETEKNCNMEAVDFYAGVQNALFCGKLRYF